MDEYIVSARKYRPDSFDTVVGQDAITQTLKNSIKNKQLAQAYLFCGPRGVGKTTCARIFAKTINCGNITADYEACNNCESCNAFNNMRSMNIHELDAASNNSVDDVRNLIDQVRIPPQIGDYSVYIIDEVHMLTSNAFNAFLKTLEEPPKHVIFILATTEKHKIIPTILSRCQVFDFNRISVDDIKQRLAFVAEKEGIKAEDEALHIIAQKADGAMRDALSIFDQIVSFCGKNITYDETIKTLNVLDYEIYFDITEAAISSDYVKSLLIFNDVLQKGFEANYFITGLASHLRDILVCKDPGTIKLLEVGEKTKQRYLEYAQKCSANFLFKAIALANQCDLNYKESKNKRLLVEIALLKICNIETPIIAGNNDEKVTMKPLPDKAATASQTKSEPTPPTPAAANAAPQTENDQQHANNKDLTPEHTATSISLKNLSRTVDKTENDSGTTQQQANLYGNDNFDNEKLIDGWKKYAETLNANPRLYTFLVNHNPTQANGMKYIVTVENNAIKKKLNESIESTLDFMRRFLNNGNFDLEYVVDENLTPKTYKKNDEEKLHDMIKSYPEVGVLAEKIELDIV